jgi:adenylate cyclase
LIEALSGQEPSPAVVEHIYSNTDGNPLFVEELVRHLDQRQSASADSGPFAHDEEHLPDSLRLIIGRRLALVGKETARILGTAAVVGRSFTFPLLEAATHLAPDRLIDAVEDAENAGLISSKLQYPDARFNFAHEVIRRVVLDELSAARRQRLHLNIAEAFELLYADSVEDHAEDLAHHFWSAGAAADRVKTVFYLQAAGEKASRSSANNTAIGHFRKALQLIRSLPETPQRLRQELSLEINLATSLMAAKGFPTGEVVEVHTRARKLSQRVGEATQFFRVLWGQWLSCASRGDHLAALEIGKQCLHVAQSAKDPLLLAQAHHTLGAGYCTTGKFPEALGHFEQAVDVYDPVRQRAHADTYGHDPGVLSLILSGFALWFLGYPDQAVKRNDEGIARGRKLSHPATLAMAAAWGAQVQQFCRNAQAVEELAGIAVDLSTRHDIAFARVMGTILGGWAMTQRGQKEAGIARMRLALDALRASGAVLMMGYFSSLLAEEIEEPEQGLKVLEGVDNSREHHWAAELHRLKGELLLRLGGGQLNNQAEAEQSFRRALTISREKKARSLELRAAMSVCRLRLRQGMRTEARLALEEIFNSFTEGYDTLDLQDAKMLFEEL